MVTVVKKRRDHMDHNSRKLTLKLHIPIIPYPEKDPGSFTLPCFINNLCFDNALVNLGASISVMPLSTYLNLGLGELAHTKLIVELADRTVKYPKGIAKNVLVGIGKFVFLIDFVILDMPKDIKVTLILKRPFLSTACAKIDVFKKKITLSVGKERIIFKSVKPSSSLIKWVYMLSLIERMELDLEVRLMGETLVLNRSLDPLDGYYIELNDLNEPTEIRRNQGDDLIPTIEEGEVIEEFRTRDDELDTGIDDYPSYCDNDKKIHIDYKMVYKGNNVVGALMNVPIFVGTFSAVTDFAVLEDMDAYRDEGMGDVIVGEPFLKEIGIKDLVKEISTNIGGEFTNMEILKCWSLKTSRRLFNTQSCSINLHGESTEKISKEFLILILFNSCTIPKTINHKVINDGGYGNDIPVGAAMILANVSVFTPKPSKHYLNITMRNVVEVFCKDTVPGNSSG
nr:hypothetical protein [Tanacetum cinerariifolium]